MSEQRHSVIAAIETAIQQTVAEGLSADNLRVLNKGLVALTVAKEAFADPIEEFDAIGERDAAPRPPWIDAGFGGPSPLSMAAPALGVGFDRVQRPDRAETFMSVILREMVAIAPKFLEQGRIRVEADRAMAASRLAAEIDTAALRKDEATVTLLRAALTKLLEGQQEPVTQGEAAAGVLRVFENLPPVTRAVGGGVVGMAAGAVQKLQRLDAGD